MAARISEQCGSDHRADGTMSLRHAWHRERVKQRRSCFHPSAISADPELSYPVAFYNLLSHQSFGNYCLLDPVTYR